MSRTRAPRIVVGIDGSPGALAALDAAVAFPWPHAFTALGVVGRGNVVAGVEWSAAAWAAMEESLERVADEARVTLRRRWPEADVALVDKPAVEAIVGEARDAAAIVVGSRGYGAIARLFVGSVSKAVVRRATCPTLVVKSRTPQFTRFVVGVDGSAHARSAVKLVASLPAPRGGHVTVLRVVEPVPARAIALVPSRVRGMLMREVRRLNAERLRAARRNVAAAVSELRRRGWVARGAVRSGVPLDQLLAVATAAGAHVVVVGARGIGGVERLLLGSVAEGVLHRSAAPVLLVR